MAHIDGIVAHDYEPKVYHRKWWQFWEPRARVNLRWQTQDWIPPYG